MICFLDLIAQFWYCSTKDYFLKVMVFLKKCGTEWQWHTYNTAAKGLMNNSSSVNLSMKIVADSNIDNS